MSVKQFETFERKFNECLVLLLILILTMTHFR